MLAINEKRVKAVHVMECPAEFWENPECIWLVDGQISHLKCKLLGNFPQMDNFADKEMVCKKCGLS
jgi:hypothetical protein